MGALEQVMDLKLQGISDYEISRRLQEQGISPVDIKDALDRAQIKSAVSESGSMDGMEPSILGPEEEPERLPLEGLEGGTLSDEDLSPPKPSGFPIRMTMPRRVTQEVSGETGYESEEVYSPQPPQYRPASAPQQDNYDYSQQYQPSPEPSMSMGDTDTLIEVAEQVFFEKNKHIQKKVDEFNEFRTLIQTKVDNISDRLKRMESIIDRLQASILEKIGSYGQGLETVRKEMTMMQDSFGKVINRVVDSAETKHHTHHRHHPTEQKQEKHATISHTGPHHVTVHKSTKRTIRKHKKK